MITQILGVVLCAALFFTAPLTVNALFYLWVMTAMLRVSKNAKKAEEATTTRNMAGRDKDMSELKAYRAQNQTTTPMKVVDTPMKVVDTPMKVVDAASLVGGRKRFSSSSGILFK